MPNDLDPAVTASASVQPEPAPDHDGLLAARQSAVLADLDRCALLAIAGPDAGAFLQGQLSNDVKALNANKCQYTSYNTPKGRMLANFVLWQRGPDSFRALLPAELAETLAKRLRMFVLRSKVTLTVRTGDVGVLGVGGPAADTVLRNAFGSAPPVFGVAMAAGATVLALPGPRFIVIAPEAAVAALRDQLARHARPVGLPVWQWLTIDAGVPVITAATQDQFVLQMANWDVLGGVSFQKGCYPGQEIVARTRYLGRLKERLYALHTGVPTAPGARLFSAVFGDQPCGTVVNAAAAPEGGWDLLAVAQSAAADARDLRLGGVDGTRLEHRALPYASPAPPPPKR
jgi:folate-binding protein YgfZ